jgi:hypothetical protein
MLQTKLENKEMEEYEYTEITLQSEPLILPVSEGTEQLFKVTKSILFSIEEEPKFSTKDINEYKSHIWFENILEVNFEFKNPEKIQNFSLTVEFEKEKKMKTFYCSFIPVEASEKFKSVQFIGSYFEEGIYYVELMNNGNLAWENVKMVSEENEENFLPEVEPNSIFSFEYEVSEKNKKTLKENGFLCFMLIDDSKALAGDFIYLFDDPTTRATTGSNSFRDSEGKICIETDSNKRKQYDNIERKYKKIESELGLNKNNPERDFKIFKNNIKNCTDKQKLREILSFRNKAKYLQTKPRKHWVKKNNEYILVTEEKDKLNQENHDNVIKIIESRIQEINDQ